MILMRYNVFWKKETVILFPDAAGRKDFLIHPGLA